ncbi:RhoGAP domain-containing protein [Tieghemostelium lacteum]|uniref:RhoGAP domain-containing protein n=1 Tax=Tieghemostelium lacteum TaxID=361077 RepID=A0A152A2U0_TIELA|nr:RhoGAP domain-containing protein [Tieghemostelium lacteum]|eukprot:KYR00573.1 RhoGAP domain-containing protein [Tieghemostelium lacteum]
MKKINQVKFSMKEKIYKKESLTNVPDYKTNTKSLNEIKDHSKEILNKMAKQTKHNQALIEDNAALGENLVDFGTWYQNEGNCTALGNTLRTFGDLMIQMEVCRSKLNIATTSRFSEPLQEFLKNDLKDAFLAKSRYDKFRISFDAASEQFKSLRKKQSTSPDKLAESEDYLNQVTQEFSEVANESLFQMEDVIDRFNLDTFDRVYDSIKLYQDYFQRGLEVINNILPDMEQHKNSIQKVKLNISEKLKKRMESPVVFERQPPRALNTSSNSSPNTSNTPSVSAPTTNSAHKIFGLPLSVVVEREGRTIPLVIEKTIEYLEAQGLDQEGIFRVSPNQKYLTELKANINSSSNVNGAVFITSCDDPHIISAFLKSYLRELPIPIITFDIYKPLVKLALTSMDAKDNEKAQTCQSISQLLQTLPTSNLALTKSLLGLLYKICQNSQINKMTASNLAVVLAPNILYPKNMDIQAISDSNSTLDFLIKNYISIFQDIKTPQSSTPTVSNGSTTSQPTPPKLPNRPQTIVFKSAPVLPSTPLPPTPTSSNNNKPLPSQPTANPKRLSNSGSILPPTGISPIITSSLSNSGSSSPLSSSSSSVLPGKPISNRASIYMQNIQQNQVSPSLPPKPSPSSTRKSNPSSTNTSPNVSSNNLPTNNRNLPPTPPSSLSSSFSSTSSVSSNSSSSTPSKRPQGIFVTPGTTTIYNDGSKITYNLLDDSVALTENHGNFNEDDDLIQW